MAYAIIKSGGKQFRVEEGQQVRVPLMDKEVGSTVELDVLLLGGDSPQVGAPVVDGARVAATVVDHGRDTKIIVFKKKRRKQYKRTRGHRQDYTTLKIDSIG
ncbi:MAG TPA: 50S ribosomal protein L21 [Pyrinomonadaceae bacterium]|nr:50S ribosomal protein L21 [Pyrinomonadaceae bacterium]